MMRRHVITWSLAVVVMVGLSGCVAGYNSMLFVTKTNAGLVIDTKPPEVSLDIGRFEGLISPTFEAGKTPPVMASFRFDSGKGFLSNYIGSAFTTGDAAVAMARLYGQKDLDGLALANEGTNSAADWSDLEKRYDSKVDLYLEPKMPWFVPKEDLGAVRPLLFGTDTSFGFKVAWTDPGSPLPDYLRLAYQRRELALAAVTIGPKLELGPDGKVQAAMAPALEARVPSLLATVDASVHVGEFLNSGFNYLQYFATGSAATALAMRQKVRQAMLHRLDPKQDITVTEIDVPSDAKAHRKCINEWKMRDDSATPPGLNPTAKMKVLDNWLDDQAGPGGDGGEWLLKASPEDVCVFINGKYKINCPEAPCP